jgi:hypothetical protein
MYIKFVNLKYEFQITFRESSDSFSLLIFNNTKDQLDVINKY